MLQPISHPTKPRCLSSYSHKLSSRKFGHHWLTIQQKTDITTPDFIYYIDIYLFRRWQMHLVSVWDSAPLQTWQSGVATRISGQRMIQLCWAPSLTSSASLEIQLHSSACIVRLDDHSEFCIAAWAETSSTDTEHEEEARALSCISLIPRLARSWDEPNPYSPIQLIVRWTVKLFLGESHY